MSFTHRGICYLCHIKSTAHTSEGRNFCDIDTLCSETNFVRNIFSTSFAPSNNTTN